MRESNGDSGHWSLGSPGLPRPFLRSQSYERALEPEVAPAFRDGFANIVVSCKLALISGDTLVQVPSAEPKPVAKMSRAQNRSERAGPERGIRSRNEESFLECQIERAPAIQMDLVENTEVKDSKR